MGYLGDFRAGCSTVSIVPLPGKSVDNRPLPVFQNVTKSILNSGFYLASKIPASASAPAVAVQYVRYYLFKCFNRVLIQQHGISPAI